MRRGAFGARPELRLIIRCIGLLVAIAAPCRQRARGRWFLRRTSKVGRKAIVLGWPTVDATDLEVGDDFKVWSGHRRTLISGWGPIRIGSRVFVNNGTVIIAVKGIEIGDDVAFANEVLVLDSDSHGVEGRPHVEAPVRIGDGTWLGARSMVLPGVTIGKRVLGLRIRRLDGRPADFGSAVIMRWLVPYLVTAVPLVGVAFQLVDALFIFRDDRRCLHDLVAGTRVEDVRRA